MKKRSEYPAFPFRKGIVWCVAMFFAMSTIAPTQVLAETKFYDGGSIDESVQGNTINWGVTENPVCTAPNFGVALGNTLNITGLTPNASLTYIVNGDLPSDIIGNMNLSWIDFLLQNIAGINIGSSAMINVNNASFIASTLPVNLTNTNFLTHQYEFSGEGSLLKNAGKIQGYDAALVALISNSIENTGTIDVPVGNVVLAAGNVVTIGLSGDGMVSVAVDEATANAMGLKDQIKNSGSITADGGVISLTAKAIDGLFDKAINLASEPQATGVVRADDGKIEFVATGNITNSGTVQAVRGKVSIHATGDVETRGVLKALEVIEHGASFKMGGWIEVGTLFMDNLDHRADIVAGAQLSGNFTDGDDISVLGDFSLVGDTTLQTNFDGENDDGTLTWDGAYTLTGNNYNLTLKVSQDSTVGAITGVNLLTFDKNDDVPVDATVTYTGSGSEDISVSTIKTTYGTTFSKDVTDIDGNNLIYSVSDAAGGLQYMNQDPSGSYKLANNIDASETSDWNRDGESENYFGFAPIVSFTGTFDGDGKTITGLRIDRPTEDNVGLFGDTENAILTIKNVGLLDVKITGRNNVGALVGYNYNSVVDYCYATGEVKGEENVGGLVGYSYYSSIDNSYAEVDVTGSGNNVGGLVGYNRYSSIDNSYATGTVTGANYVGGLVGNNYWYSTIDNSYASVTVTGTGDYVGGLVGFNYYSSIDNSYATGEVTGVNSVGGLVGYNYWYPSIDNSYATGDVTGASNVGGLVGYNDSSSTIDNSYATGAATATEEGGYAGGLVGSDGDSGTFTNNWWYNDTNASGVGRGDEPGSGQIDKAGDVSDFYSPAHAVYNGDAQWDIFTPVWDMYTDELPRLHFEGHSGNIYSVWTGTTTSGWSEASNWVGDTVPGELANIFISAQGNNAIVDSDISVSEILVGSDVTLDPGAFTITGAVLDVYGTLLVNAATFDGNYSGFATVTLESNSTVNYSGDGDQTIMSDESGYSHLETSGSGNKTLEGDVLVSGDLTLGDSTTLDVNGKTLTVDGSFVNNGTLAMAVTGITASNKEYDGDTDATIDTADAALAGSVEINGQTVALDTGDALGTFASPDAGVGITVTISGLTLTLEGADIGNYTITAPAVTADITTAPSDDATTTDPAPPVPESVFNVLDTLPFNQGNAPESPGNTPGSPTGPVYFYQAPTPFDMDAFEAMTLGGVMNLQFPDGLAGHEGLWPRRSNGRRR